MNTKIITDSTSDLPQSIADKLGITIIPLYVLFGKETYRDRIDISEDGFYKRLIEGPIHPTTSQPSPQDFIKVYDELSKGANGIISIHISSKLSGTCSSAWQAAKNSFACPVEVIDSSSVSMGLGLIAIAAATLANNGESFETVITKTRQMIEKIHVWALFDTLKYLALGGRIGKAQALMGSMLNIKPVLAVKNGEMTPVTKARNREKGMTLLNGFVEKLGHVEDLSVIYTTTKDEADAFAEHLKNTTGNKDLKVARLGPALGVHAGPGTIGVAARVPL